MALIINNKELVDSHEYIELNLNNRTFSSLNKYVVSVAGDNNSQKLTFKFKNEYDGIPLIGTSCLLLYYTSWLDDDEPPKPSSGIINLPMIENEEEGYITAEWVLTKDQTYRDGSCTFSIMFYLPINENFYSTNNIETIVPVYDDGKIRVKEDGDLTEYEYYSLNMLPSSFTIIPSIFAKQENFIGNTVYDDLIMEVDSKLNPESRNPVENKTLFDLLTVEATSVKNASQNELVITNGIDSTYPLEIKVKQVRFKTIVGDNKYSAAQEWIGEGVDHFLDGEIFDICSFTGSTITVSFDLEGIELTKNLMVVGTWREDRMEVYKELTMDVLTNETTGNKRYYFDFVVPEQSFYYAKMFMPEFESYRLTEEELLKVKVSNIAVRTDGKHDYEEYNETKEYHDLTKVTVEECISNKTAHSDNEGNVMGLYATGKEIKLIMEPYNDDCSLSVTYRKNLIDEVVQKLNLMLLSSEEVI